MDDVYWCSDCKTYTVCDCPLPNLDDVGIGMVDNNPVLRGLSPSLPDGSIAKETITTLADRLGVVAAVKDKAIVIYKKFDDDRIRNLEATLAACLWFASWEDDKQLTVKEICSVTDGATKKEIEWAKEYMMDELLSGCVGFSAGGDCCFMIRQGLICSNLGLKDQAVKAVGEAILNSKGFPIRSDGISVAAAVIYIVTQLSDDKKPLKDISDATRVAEGTIRSAYENLYPHISKIIPSWYATDDDLKNLCSPW